jgi:hypothetical protein
MNGKGIRAETRRGPDKDSVSISWELRVFAPRAMNRLSGFHEIPGRPFFILPDSEDASQAIERRFAL